jgi:hypothetical protein
VVARKSGLSNAGPAGPLRASIRPDHEGDHRREPVGSLTPNCASGLNASQGLEPAFLIAEALKAEWAALRVGAP